jgi:hypothetical protein
VGKGRHSWGGCSHGSWTGPTRSDFHYRAHNHGPMIREWMIASYTLEKSHVSTRELRSVLTSTECNRYLGTV